MDWERRLKQAKKLKSGNAETLKSGGADANHLATATCGAVDYLLTWNYRHLANAVVLHGLEKFLRERGLLLPRVCTPEELMGT